MVKFDPPVMFEDVYFNCPAESKDNETPGYIPPVYEYP
jgi:hypothetical protein